ncbi:MAG: ATP synthase F0 subunit C [Planctomycetes bacterium]|nr:ATP synthase F0 subunit C [Planctomycetota bacterium]
MDWNVGLLGLSIGLGMAIAASVGAISQSRAIWRSVEAIARQPEAGGRIFTSMIIGLALIETLVIYTLLVTGIFLQGSLTKVIDAKYGIDALNVEKEIHKYEEELKKEKGK